MTPGSRNSHSRRASSPTSSQPGRVQQERLNRQLGKAQNSQGACKFCTKKIIAGVPPFGITKWRIIARFNFIDGGYEVNFEPFLDDLQSVRQASTKTIRAYRNDLRLFEDFARGRSVSDPSQIDSTMIAAYMAWMREKPNRRTGAIGLADTSIARRLAALSTFMDYARQNSDFDFPNPLKGKRRRWQKNAEPNPVDDYVLDLLLASIPTERDRVLFTLLAASGLRVSELQQLNRDSIEIKVERRRDGKVRAIGSGQVIGKGRKRRAFYVDDNALRVLIPYLKSRRDDNPALFISERKQRMSVRAMEERLAHWCKQFGFKHINVHRLRHSYATRLANAGIQSEVLKTLMGHNSSVTTAKYFKLSDTTLARGYFAAMERIGK